MYIVHQQRHRIGIGRSVYTVAEIEDVAGLSPSMFQHGVDLVLQFLWWSKQCGRIEVALNRGAVAEDRTRLGKRNSPIDADHVRTERRDVLEKHRTLVWEIDQRHICGSQAVDHAVVQKFPSTLFLIVVLFAIFEVGFYIVMATRAAPLLGRLAWSNVAVGNLVAALGMGYYLWKMHPEIREKLIEHPLGETVDGE